MRTAGSHVHHAPFKRRSLFATREAILGEVDRHHHHTHTPHLALTLGSLPFFFALDVPTAPQVSDECELHNKLPLSDVPKTSRRNLFGTAGSAREGFSPRLSWSGGACRCKSVDHQLLSGEADSDEVQLLTVGGETEDDFFLPTFVKVGEFGLEDARGPQRKCSWPQTRPGPSPRFSWCRCAFLRRRTITRSSAPKGDEFQRLKFKRMVPRQCSLSPGGRLRCCGAESGCTHAAAKHGDGCGDQGDEVRPGSATDVHARLLRSLSQFDASAVLMELFRGSAAVQQWFLGHVQVRIYAERSRCEINLELHAETGST